MASSINTSSLDINYPVAGQDNDSQGFRDNFSNIKNNFDFAKTEIEDLQNGVARINSSNNFNGNTISNAVFLANKLSTNTTYSTGTASNQTLSYNQGQVFVIRATGNITLTLSDFPINGYSQMRIILTGDGNNRTVNFSVQGGGTVKTDGAVAWTTNNITVSSSSNPTIIEASTYDKVTFFLRYLGNFS